MTSRRWSQRVRSGLLLLAAMVLAALWGSGPALAAPSEGGHVRFTITSPRITESSALALSTTHPGLVYTSNDSGDGPTVYVLDDKDGSLVGTSTLAGVTAVDIEALAIGADGQLVVADIGDNHGDRGNVDIYRLPEPGRGDSSVQPERVSLTYQGGPRDAEAIVYDSASGRVYIAGKGFAGQHVYRSPRDVFSRDRATMRPVADAPPLTTDATLLPGARVAVLRTYFAASFYRFPSWHRVASMELPVQRQGESVAVVPSGKELWIGSEGKQSTVLEVPVPDLTRSSPASPTSSASPPVAEQSVPDLSREGDKATARLVIAGAAALLAITLGVLVIRARRTRIRP